MQALDLVVDLLQLARRGQHVLGVVGGVEDDPLRLGGRVGEGERRRRQRRGPIEYEGKSLRGLLMLRGDHVRRPIEALALEPRGGEAFTGPGGDDLGDRLLVGF